MPQNIVEVINNPWITGIGAGIISGLIVYVVTAIIFSRRQNREYSQKVTTANNEILYIIRPLIAQKKIPSGEVIVSIISSIARKYEINKTDILDIMLIIDELVREVAENTFLTPEQKIEFCEKVNELRETRSIRETKVVERFVYQKDRISSRYISLVMAGFSSLVIVFIAIFPMFIFNNRHWFDGSSLLSLSSIITIMAIVMSVYTLFSSTFIKRLSNKGLMNNQKGGNYREEDSIKTD